MIGKDAARMLATESGRRDRIRAAIWGGALGNAFGQPVEDDNFDAIRQRYGPEGWSGPALGRGTWVTTDATQLTLFTMEGLLMAKGAATEVPKTQETLESLRRCYLDWLRTQGRIGAGWRPYGELHRNKRLQVQRAPGMTCLSALTLGGHGDVDRPLNDSKGSGGVMRSGPLGLVPLWWRTRQAFDMAARAAALTHGHPCGYLSAGVLAAILRELIDGIELRSAVNESLHLLRHWPRHDATEAAVRKALDAVDRPLAREVDLAQHFGEAWVGEEALAIGLYAASVAVDYVDALTIAANHSGDSDTTAGIAGQIFGASRGMAALPKGWPNALDLYNEIGELTERLIEAAA